MKKYLGITRNKLGQFQTAKLSTLKKKNRFKSISKDEDLTDTQQPQTQSLVTSATQNSVNVQLYTSKGLELYEEAKDNLKQVENFQHQINTQCQLRITVFKESQANEYDKKISTLSKKAIEHLLIAQKTLSSIRKLKGSNEVEQKYYRNMQRSLAQQLRYITKQLRAQQKKHLDRVKIYEKSTINTAIQLSQTQKQKMRGDIDYEEQSSVDMIEEQQQSNRDSQIHELVKNINKLSSMYKQMNELVVQQGSIIDRIDYNIEETFTQIVEGNENLKGAEENARNNCAGKCMVVLVSLIIVLAIILGFKYSK